MNWDNLFNWMAWTTPTAIFFAFIGVMLLVMTVLEVVYPTTLRKGFLPLTTTRGDRLFIALLSAAFLHLLAIGWSDISLYIPLTASVMWLLILLRWG